MRCGLVSRNVCTRKALDSFGKACNIPGKSIAGTRAESLSVRQSFAWIPQAVSVMLGKVGG